MTFAIIILLICAGIFLHITPFRALLKLALLGITIELLLFEMLKAAIACTSRWTEIRRQAKLLVGEK